MLNGMLIFANPSTRDVAQVIRECIGQAPLFLSANHVLGFGIPYPLSYK